MTEFIQRKEEDVKFCTRIKNEIKMLQRTISYVLDWDFYKNIALNLPGTRKRILPNELKKYF